MCDVPSAKIVKAAAAAEEDDEEEDAGLHGALDGALRGVRRERLLGREPLTAAATEWMRKVWCLRVAQVPSVPASKRSPSSSALSASPLWVMARRMALAEVDQPANSVKPAG